MAHTGIQMPVAENSLLTDPTFSAQKKSPTNFANSDLYSPTLAQTSAAYLQCSSLNLSPNTHSIDHLRHDEGPVRNGGQLKTTTHNAIMTSQIAPGLPQYFAATSPYRTVLNQKEPENELAIKIKAAPNAKKEPRRQAMRTKTKPQPASIQLEVQPTSPNQSSRYNDPVLTISMPHNSNITNSLKSSRPDSVSYFPNTEQFLHTIHPPGLMFSNSNSPLSTGSAFNLTNKLALNGTNQDKQSVQNVSAGMRIHQLPKN
jgi:hypothetical protein